MYITNSSKYNNNVDSQTLFSLLFRFTLSIEVEAGVVKYNLQTSESLLFIWRKKMYDVIITRTHRSPEFFEHLGLENHNWTH
jgi:hypothetical protein